MAGTPPRFRCWSAVFATGSTTTRASLTWTRDVDGSPREWERGLRATPSLREQLRRARAKGLVVRRAMPDEIEDESRRKPMEELARRWLVAHGMPPMGFLVDLQPFDHPHERRYWLAEI